MVENTELRVHVSAVCPGVPRPRKWMCANAVRKAADLRAKPNEFCGQGTGSDSVPVRRQRSALFCF